MDNLPRISREKVLKKIAQYWPELDPQLILNILEEYGVESYEREQSRVQLAIIKLSEGDRGQLEEYVSLAKTDYRDVLAYAEYPEEMKTSYKEMRQISAAKTKALRQRDREHYLKWIDG